MALLKRDGVLATEHSQSFLAVAIVFPLLATVFVGARFSCRRLTGLFLGMDDWLILAALIFYYGQTAEELYTLFGAKLGSHTWTLGAETLLLQYKITVPLQVSYAVVISLARCSLCMLFIRIFITRSFKLAAIGNLAFNIAWGIYTVFVVTLRCSPAQATFDARVPGKCLDQTAVFVSFVIWGIVCDLVTWSLPIRTVWGLQLPTANRIAISLVFGLGLVVVAIGIVRIVTVYTIDYNDFSYSATTASNWAFAECGIAIMTACGPILRPLFDRMVPKIFLSSHRTIPTNSSRSTRSHDNRKAYGQLREHQIELVTGMSGSSRALTSTAATPTPNSDLEDKRSFERALGDSGERHTGEQDIEAGIHMHRSVTVTVL